MIELPLSKILKDLRANPFYVATTQYSDVTRLLNKLPNYFTEQGETTKSDTFNHCVRYQLHCFAEKSQYCASSAHHPASMYPYACHLEIQQKYAEH